jgi:23S rRNA (uracil1939-C5)-methyltransferase
MVERLSIARLGARGDGVADTPAGTLYVPYTLPGEIAEVDQWPGHADRRHLIKVDSASPDRIAPICPHFGTCGGCALQHLATARYRHWKRALVTEALAKAGLDAAVDDLIDAHGDGRRRAVFHARRGTHDVLEVGFAALKAHRVVAIDRCPILAPGLDGAIETAWAIAEALAGTRKPLDIQVTATDAGLDVDVRGSGPLTAARLGDLAAIADRRRLARLTRHGEMVAQRTKPILRIGRTQLVLPPGAFLQATAAGEAILARLVEAHCTGARTVADLFSPRPTTTRPQSLPCSAPRPGRKASSRSRRWGATSFGDRSCRSNSRASMPSCSIRHGRAPRRRRGRWRRRRSRPWSRSRATRQPSRAMRVSSSTADIVSSE